MIHLLAAALFSISANLDNFVVGVAFGIQNIKIPRRSNLLVAVMTSICTFAAMRIGQMIQVFLPSRFPNYIGAGTLTLLAFYYIIKSIHALRFRDSSAGITSGQPSDLQEYTEASDFNHNQTLDTKEAVVLAVGLILNNVGSGIAASITGVSIFLTIIFTFLCSLLFLRAGAHFGSCVLGKVLGKYASLASGILLIALALIEWFN